MKYLYAAYAVTWIIHGAYLLTLWRGFARVDEERRELEREK